VAVQAVQSVRDQHFKENCFKPGQKSTAEFTLNGAVSTLRWDLQRPAGGGQSNNAQWCAATLSCHSQSQSSALTWAAATADLCAFIDHCEENGLSGDLWSSK